jgi:hypothetical protein
MTPYFPPSTSGLSSLPTSSSDDEFNKRYKELKYNRLLRKELGNKSANEKVFTTLNKEILEILLNKRLGEHKRYQLYMSALRRYLNYLDKVRGVSKMEVKPTVTEKGLESIGTKSEPVSMPEFKFEGDSDDDADRNDKGIMNIFDDDDEDSRRGSAGRPYTPPSNSQDEEEEEEEHYDSAVTESSPAVERIKTDARFRTPNKDRENPDSVAEDFDGKFNFRQRTDLSSPDKFVSTSKYFLIPDVKKTEFRQISPKRIYDQIAPVNKKASAHYLHLINANVDEKKLGWTDDYTILVNGDPIPNSNILDALKFLSKVKTTEEQRKLVPGASLIYNISEHLRKHDQLMKQHLNKSKGKRGLLYEKDTTSPSKVGKGGAQKITRWNML